MKSKNIALSGYYGFENFGDEAILSVITSKLKETGHNVTVFSKNPQKTFAKLGVNTVYTFDLKNIVTTLKNSDILISGGGSLLQDVTSLKSLFYYLFVIFVAELFKKDVIIFAQGIGPVNNFFGQFLTKILLKKCKYITVRDEKSLFRLRGWNLNPDLVSDPVWNLTVQERTPQNRVGIQLRKWKGLSSQYLLVLAQKVNQNFSDKEILIYSFQDAIDLSVCKDFEKQLKVVNSSIRTQVVSSMSIDDTVTSFAQLDYLIAMRYHACLLALKFGIPTMALSYDEKVEKIAKRFDLPCSMLDDEDKFEEYFERMKSLDTFKIKDEVKDCYFDFSKIIEKIES